VGINDNRIILKFDSQIEAEIHFLDNNFFGYSYSLRRNLAQDEIINILEDIGYGTSKISQAILRINK